MDDPSIALVVLDELNIALRYDYLDLDAVVAALRGAAATVCTSSSPAATPSRN